MAEMRLHHVGFVVANIDTAIEGFLRSLGASWNGEIYEDPVQRVRVAFIATHTQDAQVELVQPLGESSPVFRFLRDKGAGLHHVCYEVDNIEEYLAKMRLQGAVIAKRPKPATAFGGRRIAWVITSERFVIELLEGR